VHQERCRQKGRTVRCSAPFSWVNLLRLRASFAAGEAACSRGAALSLLRLLAFFRLGVSCSSNEGDAGAPEAAAQVTSGLSAQEEAIAFAWAPIHFQDVSPDGDHSLSGKADFVTRVDYDGEYTMTNNPKHPNTLSMNRRAGHGRVQSRRPLGGPWFDRAEPGQPSIVGRMTLSVQLSSPSAEGRRSRGKCAFDDSS
jgi:hypothetical protein